MPDRIEESLSRFTPSLGHLNRDALLFAAGQASARPDRKWPTLVAVLALTQALTLALLVSGVPTPPHPSPTPPSAPIVPIESRPMVPLVLRAGQSTLDEAPYATPALDDLVPDEPPLHVSSTWDELATR